MAAVLVAVILATGGFGGAHTAMGLAVQVGASLAAGAATYLTAAWLLGSEELRFVFATFRP